jgi:hypothetical protein
MNLINIASMGYFDIENRISVEPPYMKAELSPSLGGPVILQTSVPGLGTKLKGPIPKPRGRRGKK